MERSHKIVHRKRKTCRVCEKDRFEQFLPFGKTPLANSLLITPDEFTNEPFYPLNVYFCRSCSLVQLLDVIDPEVLFRNYIYVTGTSETMANHNREYARTVVDLLKLSPEDLVVEVASNDGSLLRNFKPYNVRILGVEPATNIAEKACASSVETLNVFFNSTVAQQLRESHGPAKVVIANNVLAHVDETKDFLLGCKTLLHDHGLVVIEVPYLRNLIEQLEYDTIYHEHLCYFSISTLLRLCESVGLGIVRVDHVPVHGGSLRIYAGPANQSRGHTPKVLAFADEERTSGLNELACYERFALDVQRNRWAIVDLLNHLQSSGKSIAGYGAPAKSCTFLNYCGIGTNLLPYTVDKNPMKVGLYTPGMHIPILSVLKLLEDQPDYVLILAWNFADEIMRQQKTYYDRGGRFIIPIPEPKVV
jgi:hypothetical protein